MAQSEHLYKNHRLCSIQDIISKDLFKFPVLATPSSPDYENPDPDDLPLDEDILLDKLSDFVFVKLKVLPFQDEKAARKRKGDEFVNDRTELTGEEILVPANYPGKFKFIQRPGRRHRYASIEQIIEDSPRYVKVHETVQSSPSDARPSLFVPANSVLETKTVRKSTKNSKRYLTCKLAKHTYEFSESTRVNMTSVPDPKLHTLIEVRESVLYPTCLQFENVSPNDVICENDEEALKLHLILGGPVELVNYCEKQVVIAWLKETHNICKVAIIPEFAWSYREVIVDKSAKEMDEIYKISFEKFRDDKFIRECLFIFPVNRNGLQKERLIWLRKNKIPLETLDAATDEIPPPVPSRTSKPVSLSKDIPVANVRPLNQSHQAKHHLQKALSVDSSPITTPSKDTKEKKTSPLRPTHNDKGQGEYQTANKATSGLTKEPRSPTYYSNEQIQLPILSKAPRDDWVQCLKQKARLGFGKVHHELLKRFNAKQEKGDRKSTAHIPNTGPANKGPIYSTVVDSQENKNRPLPCIPNTDDGKQNQDDDIDGDYEQVDESDEEECSENAWKGNKDYYEIPLHDLKKLSRPNQSCEDFYKYTIAEVFHCFKICRIESMASICREHGLDGGFFRNFDMDLLKSEPFSLNHFDKLKVERAILNGWRPKL